MKQGDYNAVINATMIFFVVFLFLLLFVIVIAARYAKKRQENKQLQTQFSQELLRTQLEIQEQTLRNISQEIHDNIGQVLSLVKLNLSHFATLPDPALRQRAADTLQLVSKTIADLRDLSRSLQGGKVNELGLAAVITRELRVIENAGNYHTRFEEKGSPMTLDPQKEMVLFRMVQEALQNILKHAKATTISVTLDTTTPNLLLSVTDDGIGFESAGQRPENTGIGLTNIYNRAVLINAKVCVHSSPGKGTTLSVELQNT